MKLSNLLAITGALSLVSGIAAIRLPYGFIVLGLLLIVGAFATANLKPPAPPAKPTTSTQKVEIK